MNSLHGLVASFAVFLAVGSAQAEPGAANACPPAAFLNAVNYAANPGFEVLGPQGSPVNWQNGQPVPKPAAAASWFMHSSNAGAPVSSMLEPTNVPQNGGARMLHYIAGGNEGGVYQRLVAPPVKMMFSAWIKIRRGKVAIQATGGNTGPVSWSTKVGEWEQLRVCTDGTVPVDMLVIYNQDPAGGDFYIDRVEARAIP